VPGDKSIAHRAIIFGALANGVTQISNFMYADDLAVTVRAFRELGAKIHTEISNKDMIIKGINHQLKPLDHPIQIDNVGTLRSLLYGVLASSPNQYEVIGGDYLQKRPTSHLVNLLQEMGASYQATTKNALPMKITGSNDLQGITYHQDISNAQIKSSLVLAGIYANSDTRIIRKLPTRNHTEVLANYFGADVDVKPDIIVVHPNHGQLEGQSLTVPGAYSSAALAWHHLTVTYTPPEAGSTKATLKYVFNDKTIEGLEPPSSDRDQELITRELKLDLTRLSATTDTKLYYGFVGANSTVLNSATNAVVFEELPSLVEADKNAYVVDETNKTKVSSSTDVMKDNDKTLTETTTVHPNDKLRFNYMLQYQSGKRDMLPVTVTANVPDNVTVTTDSSGNIGRVTYANAESEPIPASALDGTKLTFPIRESLSLTNPWANIELNATADPVPNVNTALEVPLSHATLEGKNYKTDVQTPPFTIQAARATLTLTKTSNDVITTSPDHSVDLTGTMKIFENDTPTVEQPINNSDINFYVSVDGGDAQLVKDTASPNGHFAIPFNSTDEKEHTITVYAVDPKYVGSDGIPDTLASNQVTYTVKVKKNDLSLVSKDEYDFQFVRADEKERIIPRKDDWGVEVNSTNTTWVLTANSTELVDESNNVFNGELIFTDEAGNTFSLQDEKALIDEDMTASPTQEVTKVSDEWDSDEGVLLHVNSGVVPSGKYTGTIYWNLSDSIT